MQHITLILAMVHDDGGLFARIPRDIRRWVLSPMILHPYRVVCGNGGTLMIGNDNGCYIDGVSVGVGDKFIRTKCGYIVADDYNKRKVGLHGICDVQGVFAPMLLEVYPIYGKVSRYEIEVMHHRDQYEAFSIGNLPDEYCYLVRFSDFYRSAMLWNGRLKLASLSCWPGEGSNVRYSEHLLPHAPVSISSPSVDDDYMTTVILTYPWGEMAEYTLR